MYRLRRIVRDWKYKIKYAWQRVFRGYDDAQVYNLDNEFIKTYTNILTQFRNNTNSYPHGMEFEEWIGIIDQLIHHLNGMVEDYDRIDYDVENSKLEYHKNEFFALFSKHFYDLWS